MEKILEQLKGIEPKHFKSIMDSIELISLELEYTKISIDGKMKDAIKVNDYKRIREMLELSEALHQKQTSIQSFIEKYSDRQRKESPLVKKLETENIAIESVDDDVTECTLHSTVTNTHLDSFHFQGRKYYSDTWIGLLIKVCEILYEEDGELFKSFPYEKSLQGKRKPRFSYDESVLRDAKAIADSGVYIETNLSARIF